MHTNRQGHHEPIDAHSNSLRVVVKNESTPITEQKKEEVFNGTIPPAVQYNHVTRRFSFDNNGGNYQGL